MVTLANSHSSANSFCYFSSCKSIHNGENWTYFLSSQEFLKSFFLSHTPHRKPLDKIFSSFFLGSSLHTPNAKAVLMLIRWTWAHLGRVNWPRFLYAIPPASFSLLDVITPIIVEMPPEHMQTSPPFPIFLLLSLHLAPGEGHSSCRIPTLGTWRGWGKQGRWVLSSLSAWTTASCTHLGSIFSGKSVQHPARPRSCQDLSIPRLPSWLTVRNKPKAPKFLGLCKSPFFFFALGFIFIFYCLLVLFFSPFCKLLPFSNCLTEHCSMTQCRQAKYWMVKCYFLKQYGTAHHQKMDHGQRHWKKSRSQVNAETRCYRGLSVFKQDSES